MNPIPLAAPDGRVYAYACGICHEACAGMHSLARPETPGPNEHLVEASLRDAEQCCTCRRCRVFLQQERYGCCPPCQAVEEQEMAVAAADAEIKNREREAKRDASLQQASDQTAARRLAALMSDVSEEHYCAGWLDSLEYELWSMVLGRSSRHFGLGDVPVETITDLQRLSEQAGGWWMWQHDVGEVFVPLLVWHAVYLRQRPAQRVVVRAKLADGTEVGLYEGECCARGSCTRPPEHDGDCDDCDQFDGPQSEDAVPMHRLLPVEERT